MPIQLPLPSTPPVDTTLHLEVKGLPMNTCQQIIANSCHSDINTIVVLNPLDASGKLRIWDTTQKEHLLKFEYTPISGKIKDIAWTEDNKRMAVVGDGREK